jgi:hypothetical protein
MSLFPVGFFRKSPGKNRRRFPQGLFRRKGPAQVKAPAEKVPFFLEKRKLLRKEKLLLPLQRKNTWEKRKHFVAYMLDNIR